jgi:hypothetical protein
MDAIEFETFLGFGHFVATGLNVPDERFDRVK